MVLDNFPTFSEWFLPGLLLFGGIVLAAIILGLFVGYVVASFRHGPFEAFYIVAQVIGESVPDFLGTSPRRVFAMARLSVKEALRRRVVVVAFIIFAILLLFGQWFMQGGTENPEKRFMNTVMFGTQILTLLTVMLISAFSLPEDIKKKTIYTIVTKPVRATEIILGRILGFGFLGTVLLALMGLISFFFVSRNLDHTHQVVGATQTIASLDAIAPGTKISPKTGKRVSENAVMEGTTDKSLGHEHRLEVLEFTTENADDPNLKESDIVSVDQKDGLTVYRRLVCQPVGGHTHAVTVTGEGPDAKISLGPAVGYFRARIPVYADGIEFLDKDGQVSEGKNVGKERGLRGFVDGGSPQNQATLSRAIFKFSNFRERRFANTDVLPLEMTLGVFRTYKGDIQKRVIGGLQLESVPDNPQVENRFISEVSYFETNEYQLLTRPISRKIIGRIETPEGTLVEEGEFDLFDDFAKNGKLEMSLSCRDVNQYLGVARSDMYFRASDDVYWFNYLKGYVGIWCQMMTIIAMAVAFSTFLGTPIVMLGVLMMMIIGFFTPFIRSLTAYDRDGGGPIESLIRIVTQKNMQVDLETGVATTLIKESDKFMTQRLSDLTYLAPNFKQLDFSEFLTYGYSIDNQRILVALAITFAFCAGLTLLGYFSLKTREIAK